MNTREDTNFIYLYSPVDPNTLAEVVKEAYPQTRYSINRTVNPHLYCVTIDTGINETSYVLLNARLKLHTIPYFQHNKEESTASLFDSEYQPNYCSTLLDPKDDVESLLYNTDWAEQSDRWKQRKVLNLLHIS